MGVNDSGVQTNIMAERAVIAGMLNYGSVVYNELATIIKDTTFSDEFTAGLWKVGKHLLENDVIGKIDLPTVLSTAGQLKLDYLTKDLDYLKSLINFPVEKERAVKLAKVLRKLEVARDYKKYLKLAIQKLESVNGSEKIMDILAIGEQAILNFNSDIDNQEDGGPQLLGNGICELIQNAMDNPITHIGLSTGFLAYDAAIGGGFRKGTINVIGARPKTGKAQPLSSIVYTPCGPRQMREIFPNSLVCTPDGKYAKVLQIFPQGYKDVFIVKFKTGQTIRACQEHLWEVFDRGTKLKQIVNTQALYTNPSSYLFKPAIYQNENRPAKSWAAWTGERGIVKSIPAEYQDADLETRTEIYNYYLDKCEEARGRKKLVTNSLEYAKQIVRIIWSVGKIGHIEEKTSTYAVYFDVDEKALEIESVEYSGREECRCILINRPDHLYIADDYVRTHNTWLSDNIGLHVAMNEKVPVLNVDTEMVREDHQYRSTAIVSGVGLTDIETGKCGKSEIDKEKVLAAANKLKNAPYFHRNVAGTRFEEQVAMIRSWIIKEVGLNPEGKANDCLVIFDYLKLTSSEDISDNMQEYQSLGFMMTTLHGLAIRYNIPILCFVQLNRDGIDKTSTAVAAGSDRIIWLCSNFSIYKKKEADEIAESPKSGNRKLYVVACRHGAGLNENEYININYDINSGKITELQTSLEEYKKKKIEGFVTNIDEDQLPLP